jgi:hypothetical protein
MSPAKFNTPLIAAGAALMGAGVACYQITGNMYSLSSVILDHLGYVLAVAAVFGAECGAGSIILNRLAR